MRKPRILVVGSFVMDLIVSTSRFPQSGETVLGLNYQTAPGGKGANQAVQAARLGADVAMVGKVGRDDFGRQLIRSAQDAGVDVSHVLVSEHKPSAVGNVQLEVSGNQSANRIIVVPGANMDITLEDVAFLEDGIAQYDMVMLQLEIPMEINLYVASCAKAKGVPVMLNCAPFAPLPEELLRCVTYLSPNEIEAQALTGLPVGTEEEIREAMKRIRSMDVPRALITLGGRGVAYEGEDGRLLLSPALKGIDVKDTTSAGDSFVAALCVAMCMDADIETALTFANHAAALTVSRMGAQPSLPDMAEVLALMESRGADSSAFRQ